MLYWQDDRLPGVIHVNKIHIFVVLWVTGFVSVYFSQILHVLKVIPLLGKPDFDPVFHRKVTKVEM